MKKISTFLCIISMVLGIQSVRAQIVAQNATTYITGPNDALMTAHVTILNTGSTSVDVSVARISQTLAPHHVSYFCWTQCYDPAVSVSPDIVTLAPGESTYVFNGDLNPQSYDGVSTVRYAYYTTGGDSVFVTYTYEAGVTGINELSAKGNIKTAFPNPATSYTKISYNINSGKDARIVICNMLGSTVKEIKLNDFQNTLTVSTADMKQGIYFYSLIVDGRTISSKKLIISHN